MGFYDSFKTGLSGVADFLGDITGAALGAAPTIIPLLQSTGVIPYSQAPQGQAPSPYSGYRPTALPGGAMIPWPVQPQVNPMFANVPLAGPVQFPTGRPTPQPTAPSGVVQMPAFQSTRGGFSQSALDLPLIDIVPQGGGSQLARLTSPFVPTQAGARAQPFVSANPITGALTWFKPAGKPILWSGDLSACRRVNKVAARARRVSRKR